MVVLLVDGQDIPSPSPSPVPSLPATHSAPHSASQSPVRSSFAPARPDGGPGRTSNRVRFSLTESTTLTVPPPQPHSPVNTSPLSRNSGVTFPTNHLTPPSSSSSSSAKTSRGDGQRRNQNHRTHPPLYVHRQSAGTARAPLLTGMTASRPGSIPASVTARMAAIVDRQDTRLYEAADEYHFDSSDSDSGTARTIHTRGLLGSSSTSPSASRTPAPSYPAPVPGDLEALAQDAASTPRSGIVSAFMNMANSIMGAGIIGQPYALRQSGLLAGLILMVVLTVVIDWTIRLVVVNSKLSGTRSFHATVERCYGRAGLFGIAIAQWAFAFGGMVAFGVIVGDTIPHVITAIFPSLSRANNPSSVVWLLGDRRVVTIVTIGLVSYPLSLYRDISKLAIASAFALGSMIVIVMAVVTQSVNTPPSFRGSLSGLWLVNWSGLVQAVGVISFAFVCHHNSLLIYGSLDKPTLNRFATVTHYSTGISLLTSLLLSLSAFLIFGQKTEGNVLNNFPQDNTIINIARLCFGLNMLTTLPLECFVCRDVVDSTFFAGRPYSQRRHVLSTTAHVFFAAGIALLTCDLGVVLEIVGATSACAIAYVLPPLCFLHLTPAAAAAAAGGAGAGGEDGIRLRTRTRTEGNVSSSTAHRDGFVPVATTNPDHEGEYEGEYEGQKHDGDDEDKQSDVEYEDVDDDGVDDANTPLRQAGSSSTNPNHTATSTSSSPISPSSSTSSSSSPRSNPRSRHLAYLSTTTRLHLFGKRMSLAAPRVAAVVVILFGTLVAFSSVVITVRGIISGEAGTKSCSA